MEEPDVILDLREFKLFTYTHTPQNPSNLLVLFSRLLKACLAFCLSESSIMWSGRKGRKEWILFVKAYFYKMDSTKYIYEIG